MAYTQQSSPGIAQCTTVGLASIGGRIKKGRVYVLMRANAGEGDHKWGGQAVYVLEPDEQRLVDVLPLKTDGFSIQITNGKEPLLAVTNANMEIDIYTLGGTHKRTIGGWGPATPYTLYGVQ